jgi:hypothetical protein
LRAASTLPAPNPSGMQKTNIIQKLVEKDIPISAIAVIHTLTAVVKPVLKRYIILLLKKLDIIVPQETVKDKIPANERGTPNMGYNVGQAVPSKESGKPRLINARYMIISNATIINPLFIIIILSIQLVHIFPFNFSDSKFY